MAQTVRAVVATKVKEPVSVVEIEVPDPGPGEALVQVQACGVCHTDLHYREGGINDELPFLLGHEAAGIVEAVGEGVTEVVPVGVPNPEMCIDLPMIDFSGRGGRLKPSWYGDCLPSRDFPMLVDLHLKGRLPLERFVSETIGLDDVEDAFAAMQRGETIRSVIVFD